ncbi:hypothetical protein [Streptomyces sp. AB3(2024)]|uniref:hypothetical protein n=1 Tax=Streptomyces sp. AB3(2024) TaxID=3317321 RepID=UPI0035A3C4A8
MPAFARGRLPRRGPRKIRQGSWTSAVTVGELVVAKTPAARRTRPPGAGGGGYGDPGRGSRPQAYAILRAAGAPHSLVNGGGDIRHGGEPAPGLP